jgi:hypothetical protein
MDTLGYTIAALRGARAEAREANERCEDRLAELEARIEALEKALR